MVEPAEADVIGPAVTTEDPYALADERAGQREEMACAHAGGFVGSRQPA